MRVTANNGHTGLSEAQLGANDVNDSLVGIAQRMQADTEFLGILSQGVDLCATGDISDRQVDIDRRSVVVLGCNREVGATNLASGHTQTIEGLRAGHLVD